MFRPCVTFIAEVTLSFAFGAALPFRSWSTAADPSYLSAIGQRPNCRGGLPQRPLPGSLQRAVGGASWWDSGVMEGSKGAAWDNMGQWSMTESDDTSTRFCSCTKTTSQLSEDIMHVIICTYMHVYIRIHCTGILGGVEPCFQLVPCKHHCNHGARQVHLAYFGHWAWCQNVDNCQEPQN